jgi:hypothetical protein
MAAFICFVFLHQTGQQKPTTMENAFYKRCVLGGIVCFRLAPHHIHLGKKRAARLLVTRGEYYHSLWARWMCELVCFIIILLTARGH